MPYALADNRSKFRLASENANKVAVVKQLVELHRGGQVLVIGQYLDQLEVLRKVLDVPLITGKTPTKERQLLYTAFREREIDVLLVSKVGNFAIDLPDANVLIQVSGTYGSRQEEAQRLGRILRRREGKQAVLYELVVEGSVEERTSAKRRGHAAYER